MQGLMLRTSISSSTQLRLSSTSSTASLIWALGCASARWVERSQASKYRRGPRLSKSELESRDLEARRHRLMATVRIRRLNDKGIIQLILFRVICDYVSVLHGGFWCISSLR